MKKKALLSILLALLIVLPPVSALAENEEGFTVIKVESTGPRVSLVQMRLRDLGYLNYRPTGVFGNMTRAAAMKFQEINSLSADGDVGEQTYEKLFLASMKRCPLPTGTKSPTGPSANNKTKKYGTADDWFSVVSAAFPKGTTAKVTDLNSGTTYQVQRIGGENHAEVETATKADTKNFLKTFDKDAGKTYTWEKRAVTVEVGGKTFAASIFGWPHGESTISGSDMPGHVCLYFSGSFSDIYGIKDPEHDAMVQKAAGK
jgi:peptidoglycan hydrolase-like protein with peptidoglycan-binding domain